MTRWRYWGRKAMPSEAEETEIWQVWLRQLRHGFVPAPRRSHSSEHISSTPLNRNFEMWQDIRTWPDQRVLGYVCYKQSLMTTQNRNTHCAIHSHERLGRSVLTNSKECDVVNWSSLLKGSHSCLKIKCFNAKLCTNIQQISKQKWHCLRSDSVSEPWYAEASENV